MITVLSVSDLCCPVEGKAVEKALQALDGVVSWRCDFASRRLTVTHEIDPETLVRAIRAIGLDAKVQSNPIVVHVPEMDCPVEVAQIEKAFAARGIRCASFDTKRRVIRVEADFDVVREAVESCGYRAERLKDDRSRIVLSVPDMDCPVEVAQIEKAFAACGISGAQCNTEKRTVILSGDDETVARAVKAIRSCGYEATLLKQNESLPEGDPIPWGRYLTALFVALLSEAVELWSHYAIESFPFSEDVATGVTLLLAVVAILMTGVSTFRSGLVALRHGNLNMNALMSVAVVGGVLIGAWPEASMVMVLFQISESIEQLAMERARRSIRDLMSVAPEKASVRGADGRFTDVPVGEVGQGAVVRVGPGDRVPLDGKILHGVTSLDESMVTGEGLPAEKGEKDPVWAGTVNLSATIDILVTAAASQSLTARIIDAVENAQASKSPVQRFVDRFATIYTPIVFLVALIVAIVPPFIVGDWSGWLYKALCLLVIACPCALVISTPVTVVSALATATRCGLLVKGGLYLEEARKLRFVGLDKTGTLTKGEPAVAAVSYDDDLGCESTDVMAASLAAMNKHPLSQAILHWAQAKGVEPLAVEGFTALPGSGVTGRVGRGQLWLVNERHLKEMGILTPDVHERFMSYAAEGMSTVALADRFGVRAVFGLSDTIKEDAAEGVRQLRSVGLTPRLLTGDTPAAAQALARHLGLEDVRAGLLPEQKLAEIESMQKEGLTAMVGDGINDAPALARSDIGIAMGVRGTDSAIEAAHVAVMDDRIGSIATLVRLSRITHTVLVENITFALGVKFLFALLALGGMASMWMAVFADVGTCLIVVANGMRMLRMKPRLDAMAAAVR